MRYKVIVVGFDSGLNELLNGRQYNPRLRKYFNPVKAQNDKICCFAIRKHIKGLKIDKPIFMRYHFFVKDKKHDRSNIAGAFVKSFEDALQMCGVIKNDGYDDVLTPEYFFEVDRKYPRVEVEIIEVE